MTKRQCNKELLEQARACDGDILHPGHAQFHILRLLIGSVLSGWTLALAFFIIGFIGNINFIRSMDLAFNWLIYGGTAIGIVLGLLFSIVAAFLIRLLPVLRRTTHPLALVRSGFILLTVCVLFAFGFWPSSIWGFIIGPMIGFLLALESIRSNPRAELVPHSTSGRVLGTATGPFVVIAVLLMILIPMFQRGFGGTYSPKLIVIATDGVDAAPLQSILSSDEKERYPNLLEMRESGGYGSINSTQPLVPARAWADLMTGQGWNSHNILDRNSSSDDLSVNALWDILAMRGYTVGLFQMLPPHEIENDFQFDIPAPGTSEGFSALNTSALDAVRDMGRQDGLPGIEESVLAACYLARYGVTLETITELMREFVLEKLTDQSPRLTYLHRKLLEFRIESDIAISYMAHHHVDAAFLRFTSLEDLFLTYWRYSYPQEFGPPPSDIDSATATGLAKALPEAYLELDRLIGRLDPFVGHQTLLTIVSNHGVRSATDIRNQNFHLSPDRIVRNLGLPETMAADVSASGVVIRIPGESTSSPEMIAMQNVLSSARWLNERPETPDTHVGQPIFTITPHEECTEVALRYFNALSKDLWITTVAQQVIYVNEPIDDEIPAILTTTGYASPDDARFMDERGMLTGLEGPWREPGSTYTRNPLTIDDPVADPDSGFISESEPLPDSFSTMPLLESDGTELIEPPEPEIEPENVEENPGEPLMIGGWQGRLGELLVPGEQPSGRINGSGLFMIVGPQIIENRTANNPFVFDFMPTILHALGIELSTDLLGRNLDELYRPGWMSSNPPVFVEEYTIPEPPPPPEPEPEVEEVPEVSTVESVELSVSEVVTDEETIVLDDGTETSVTEGEDVVTETISRDN